VLVRTMVFGISGSFMILCAYTVLPMSRFTRRLDGSAKYVLGLFKGEHLPDGNNRREKDQETENIDIPLSSKAIQCYKDK
jgi:hypothetical protein